MPPAEPSDAGPNRFDPWKRCAVNAFIACVIVLFTIDGMPGLLKSHDLLRQKLDPVLKSVGLWQGPWDLFAPRPDMENIRISAEVIHADGSVFRWRSPDWKNKSKWYLMRHYRRQEYYDNVRRNINQPAWPGLARHILQLARQQHDRDSPPTQVFLTRHWWFVPDPKEKFVRVANINEPMASYQFYHQSFPGNTPAR